MALILSGDTGPSFVQSTAMPIGSVLQVVNAGNTNNTNVSGTNVTVVSTTITPKFSTSKILVTFSCGSADNSGNSGEINMNLKRGGSTGTVLPIHSASLTGYFWSTSRIIVPVTFTYLDSPATTSSTTYGFYCTSASAPDCYVNGAQLILTEIAG
jgi:subtilisin family serine protease